MTSIIDTIRAALKHRRNALLGELPKWRAGHTMREPYLAELADIDAALAWLDSLGAGQVSVTKGDDE